MTDKPTVLEVLDAFRADVCSTDPCLASLALRHWADRIELAYRRERDARSMPGMAWPKFIPAVERDCQRRQSTAACTAPNCDCPVLKPRP
jgi:hypothetical protein